MRGSKRLLLCTAAVVAAALVPGAPALAAPGETIAPASGPPTTVVAVSGTGFGAFEAVDVYIDTTDVALALADASGSFSDIKVTIPASAVPGTHWISAVG